MAHARCIAAAQSIPVKGDVAANVAQHLRLVRAAAEEEAQVVVFPELSLTGYELDVAGELAFSARDPRLAPLIESASSHATTIVAGAPVRLGSGLHIGAFIVAPDGTVAIYTKHHMGAFSVSAAVDGTVPPAEATVFVPGDCDPLLRVGGHIAAVAVCADTGRASHPRTAAARGADTYLASMFVIPSDFDRETANLAAYAARHRMVVAFANYGGPSGGLASAGRSAIWSERGETLVQVEASGAGVAIAAECHDGWHASVLMLGGR